LERFFRNLLMGERWDLRNRYLHISPTSEWQVQPQLGIEIVSEKTKEKTTEKTKEKTTEKTTEKILCIMKNNPRVTYRELAETLAMSEDGIYWSVKQLRKQGLLRRIGGRKEGYWEIVNELAN
jgi:predicted HTH transcriptional regulator